MKKNARAEQWALKVGIFITTKLQLFDYHFDQNSLKHIPERNLSWGMTFLYVKDEPFCLVLDKTYLGAKRDFEIWAFKVFSPLGISKKSHTMTEQHFCCSILFLSPNHYYPTV